MAVRLRLLIYKGDADLLEAQRHNEFRNSGPGSRKIYMQQGRDIDVTSVELDPTRMTIRELLRVLFRREERA